MINIDAPKQDDNILMIDDKPKEEPVLVIEDPGEKKEEAVLVIDDKTENK